MSIDRAGVVKIAELARLEFSEGELEAITAQFQRILDYIEKLKKVNVEGVEPTSHASFGEGPSVRFARDDEVRASLPEEEALANAPDPGSGHFRVPKVL
jgi:aspartyl-tRNA(Asn)/glutamyl-tRNA(Gln) amidotransferase subunit C